MTTEQVEGVPELAPCQWMKSDEFDSETYCELTAKVSGMPPCTVLPDQCRDCQVRCKEDGQPPTEEEPGWVVEDMLRQTLNHKLTEAGGTPIPHLERHTLQTRERIQEVVKEFQEAKIVLARASYSLQVAEYASRQDQVIINGGVDLRMMEQAMQLEEEPADTAKPLDQVHPRTVTGPYQQKPGEDFATAAPGGTATEGPSVTQRISNFRKAFAKHAKSRFRKVPEDVGAKRLAICRSNECGFFRTTNNPMMPEMCSHKDCGCILSRNLANDGKTSWTSQACPIKMWTEYLSEEKTGLPDNATEPEPVKAEPPKKERQRIRDRLKRTRKK
jgi:hypothetical protein